MHFGVLALYGGPDQVMTVTSGIASTSSIDVAISSKEQVSR